MDDVGLKRLDGSFRIISKASEKVCKYFAFCLTVNVLISAQAVAVLSSARFAGERLIGSKFIVLLEFLLWRVKFRKIH